MARARRKGSLTRAGGTSFALRNTGRAAVPKVGMARRHLNIEINYMKYAICSVAMAAMTLCACANQSGARMGLLTTTAPVVAIVAGDLYTGESVSYIDGSGTLRLKSSLSPERECIGVFHYESEQLGAGDLDCSWGAHTTFQFRALSTLTGYGFGRTGKSDVSFTYGMTAEQAEPYLRLPTGKKLSRQDSAPVLADR
jgi:hypothetical protein